MGKVYNWKTALRKALIQAGLALFTQCASLQTWPTANQLWIPLVVAGIAFFTVLEAEEPKVGETKKNNSAIRIMKRIVADSLLG